MFIVLAALLARGSLAADAPRPSSQCLPDETVLSARIPNGRAFFDALRERTHLGATLLTEDRFNRVIKVVKEEGGKEWEEIVKELEKYQLKIEELPRLFDGELGFALVAQPRGERRPLFVGLSWAEPGGDLADRAFAAVQKAVDDQKQEEHAATRVDLDLAGHTVIHLTIPVTGLDVDPAAFALPGGKVPAGEDLEKWVEARRKAFENAKLVVVDQVHVLLTRIGNRMLMANTFPQSVAEVRTLLRDKDKKIDLAAVSGAEEVRGVFARFLEAHAGSSSGGMMERVMATPGLAAALPAGVPLVEILADPQPLLKLLAGSDPMVARVLASLAVDRLGPLALRSSLDAGALRTGFFASAAEPRAGLLAILDQPRLDPVPPAWVPASVISYSHLSCDLGKVYAQVRDLVISEFGDEAKRGFKTIEQQIESAAKSDVPTLLSSLGHQHAMVSFPPRPAPAAAPPAGAGLVPFAGPTSREGIVWQVKNEDVWKRLIQLGAGFAAVSGGAVKASEEQGFIGLRLNVEGVLEGGVFVGRGYLLLGIGPDVVEPLMATLRSPPQGEAALRSSPLVARAATLLPPESGILYDLTDYNRSIKSLRQSLLGLLETVLAQMSGEVLGVPAAVVPGANDQPVELDPAEKAELERTKALLLKIKALLPTDDELEGVLGVGVGQAVVNQYGLQYRSAIELPPAR
jgi:hypothetical protein